MDNHFVRNATAAGTPGSPGEVFRASLKLGLTSFGGPIAHLGYFERLYVRERRWLSADEYAGLVALCQFLPGPTSSQIGFLIGLPRAGWFGALAAVVVVAQAVWSMARSLCPDRERAAIALLAAALLLFHSSGLMQLATLLGGGGAGCVLCRKPSLPTRDLPMVIDRRRASMALFVFAGLLIALPVAAAFAPHGWLAMTSIFYRAGAFVFGGGHVVLPLLHESLVPNGWVSDDTFLAGYGFAQGMPGPLFTLAAYLGAASAPAQATLAGINAAVALCVATSVTISLA